MTESSSFHDERQRAIESDNVVLEPSLMEWGGLASALCGPCWFQTSAHICSLVGLIAPRGEARMLSDLPDFRLLCLSIKAVGYHRGLNPSG